MSKFNGSKSPIPKKKTRQGQGLFSKKSPPGGENFLNGHRSGSPPSKFRRKGKPRRGQGR